MSDQVLGIDLGGTKVIAAVVSKDGTILEVSKQYVDHKSGPSGLVQQLVGLSTPLISKYSIKSACIASAGPLDPIKGVLLDPTNFKTEGQGWGEVPLIDLITQKLAINWCLENDAAAAALGEGWVGVAKQEKNFVMVTLGTGLGVGAVCNGEIVRSGQYLHPEAGHIIIDAFNVENALCGCGDYGCAEALLSGKNFTRRLGEKWNESGISGEMIVSRARNGDQKAIAAMQSYGRLLAYFVRSLVVLFSPKIIIFSGGFSSSYDLFKPSLHEQLEPLMVRRRKGVDLWPNIMASRFGDEIAVLGAARRAFQKKI